MSLITTPLHKINGSLPPVVSDEHIFDTKQIQQNSKKAKQHEHEQLQ